MAALLSATLIRQNGRMAPRITSVDAYVATLPEVGREVLGAIRRIVADVAPDVVETMSYDMPTFVVDGTRRLYVAAWKKHLGFYGVPVGGEALESALAPYRQEKGTISFAYRTPIPYDLVGRIVSHVLGPQPDGRAIVEG